MTLKFNMTFISKSRHESEQEDLEELKIRNKDLGAYELYRTTSCIQMAAQTVRKWASSAFFSKRLLCPSLKPKFWRVHKLSSQRRQEMNPSKQGKYHRFLLPTIMSRKDEIEDRLVSYLSLSAREVNSFLCFVTQDPAEPVSCSPQWQCATAG